MLHYVFVRVEETYTRTTI